LGCEHPKIGIVHLNNEKNRNCWRVFGETKRVYHGEKKVVKNGDYHGIVMGFTGVILGF